MTYRSSMFYHEVAKSDQGQVMPLLTFLATFGARGATRSTVNGRDTATGNSTVWSQGTRTMAMRAGDIPDSMALAIRSPANVFIRVLMSNGVILNGDPRTARIRATVGGEGFASTMNNLAVLLSSDAFMSGSSARVRVDTYLAANPGVTVVRWYAETLT